METLEYLRRLFATARFLTDGAIWDVTDDQLNWTPPGTANPVSAILLHAFGGEDGLIQRTLRGRPTIWEADRWGEKIGVPAPPTIGSGWEVVMGKRLSASSVLDYGRAVRAATDEYLASVNPEELDRMVTAFGGERPIADVLSATVIHFSLHAGEVAALKGVQGGKGLPV
ncbi:MAG: DinB family protein [Chloroflexi bacterium]|nr:DinB family protein [Chloroflexota bacterium]